MAVFLLTIAVAQETPKPTEADFVTHNFHFRSGEVLPRIAQLTGA